MTRNRLLASITGGVLFIGALAAGVVLTGGLSQSDNASAGAEDDGTPSPEETEEAEPADSDEKMLGASSRFQELLADELGISVGEVEDAYTAASLALIHEAEADGRLRAEEADEARERVEEGGFFPASQTGFHQGFGFALDFMDEAGRGHHLAPFDGVAELLGLTDDELRAAIEDGQSLAEVAESAGVSLDELTEEVLANVRASLDEAVANEGLTKERADEMYAHFESSIEELLTGDFDAPMRSP